MKKILNVGKPVIILILVCVACDAQHPTYDYSYKQLKISGLVDSVDIVGAGNLVGSEKDELIIGRDSTLYIYDIKNNTADVLFTTPYLDNIQKLQIGDADNDENNELIIATGAGYAENSSVRIHIADYNDNGWNTKEIYSLPSSRSETNYLDIVDIDDDGFNEVIASYYESKYMVETVVISNDGDQWKDKIIDETVMATSHEVAVLPNAEHAVMVVGRVYGDSSAGIGDAYIMNGSKKIELSNVFRGVRALAVGDGDNDGKNEIYVGDGWHVNYGKLARPRIAAINYSDNSFQYDLIEDVHQQQFAIMQIQVADVTGDGENEVIARGNKYFYIYQFDDEKKAWKVFADTAIATTIGVTDGGDQYEISNQFTIGDITGDGHAEIIFSSNTFSTLDVNKTNAGIYSFGSQLNYSFELGKDVRTKDVDPKSLVGEPAPKLRISKWLNGTFPGIEESEAEVILLDFWATWCGPCIEMFPHLEEMQKKYGDDGLQVLGITRVDGTQTMEEIKQFVKEENFAYPIGVSEEDFTHIDYGVVALPSTFIIDEDGIVRIYLRGLRDGDELEKEILKLLKD